MPATVPVSFRETLGLLRFYRKEVGLGPLFQSANNGTWSTRQIYYAVHARRPDTLSAVLNEGDNPEYNIFAAALNSDELRKQHPVRVLRAYPEKQRIFFIQIPRSAGQHFGSHMTSRFATVDTRLCQREAASDEDFLQYLKHLALEIDQCGSIFITGPGHLALYEGWGVLRHEDRIVTILREPVSQAISQINYIVGRILSSDPNMAEDTRNWRQMLQVDDAALHQSREELQRLARRLLHDTAIIAGNVACAYLGGGSYDKAIERIAIHDVEVVDLESYDVWARETWDITASVHPDHPGRVNAATQYLSPEDFSSSDIDRMRSLTDQDRRLYADLTRARKASGAASAKGVELVRPAKPPARAPVAPISPEPAQTQAPPAPTAPVVRVEAPAPEPPVPLAGPSAVEPPAPHPVDEAGALLEPAAASVADPLHEIEAPARGAEPEPGRGEAPDSAAPPEPDPAPAQHAPPASPAAAAAALSAGELMKSFESIGENCELGLVQRQCGTEPLGLLRFASAPLPKLLHALRERFAGLGHPANVEVQLSDNGREYMILDKAFGFLYHAWVLAGEKTPEEIHAREVRRVPFLVRKLTEDLASGDKIFVFHGMTPLRREEALDLMAELHRYGPSVLLWVELADEDHAPGTVEQIVPGLIKGYIDRFAPGENAHDLSLECWIDVCRGAKALSGR